MNLEFNLEREDIYHFHLHQTFQTKSKSKKRYFYLGFFLLIIGYSVYNDVSNDRVPYISIIWSVLLGLVFLLNPFFIKRQLMRNLNKPENEGLFGLVKLQLDKDRLLLQKDDSSSSVKWSAFVKLEENEHYFFIYNTSNSAVVIPKQKVASHLNELKDLLTKKFN